MQEDNYTAEKKQKTEVPVAAFWEKIQMSGVPFFIDGEAVLPDETAFKVVRESGCYMADYVLGTNGQIEQVRFDKVIVK